MDVSGEIPGICPQCHRIGRWSAVPPPGPLESDTEDEPSDFDRGFLKALESMGAKYFKPKA